MPGFTRRVYIRAVLLVGFLNLAIQCESGIDYTRVFKLLANNEPFDRMILLTRALFPRSASNVGRGAFFTGKMHVELGDMDSFSQSSPPNIRNMRPREVSWGELFSGLQTA